MNQSQNTELDSSALNEIISPNEANSNADEDDNEEDDESWFFYLKQKLQNQVYNLSGIELLKINPKKPK